MCIRDRWKPLFCKEVEQELVSYLIETESLFHGLTITDVRRLAFQLDEKNNISHPFGDSGLAGMDWLYGFLNRHKNILSILKPSGTSYARAKGFNKKEVSKCFDLLEQPFEKYKFPGQQSLQCR